MTARADANCALNGEFSIIRLSRATRSYLEETAGTEVAGDDVSVSGHQGRRVRSVIEATRNRVEEALFFVVEGRLYIISASGVKGAGDPVGFRRFLDSFRFRP